MNHFSFQLDQPSYGSMLRRLNSLHFTDRAGTLIDIGFLIKDDWLVNAAVCERLVRRKGLYEIHLLFAYHQDPMTFISRYITSVSDIKKAMVMATLMRRQAAKDQRGTIKLDPDFWKLPPN